MNEFSEEAVKRSEMKELLGSWRGSDPCDSKQTSPTGQQSRAKLHKTTQLHTTHNYITSYYILNILHTYYILTYCILAYLHTYLHTYIITYLPNYILTYLHT